MPGIGNDWCIQFNDASLASLSGGSARAAFCNNGAASQVWAFRSLYVTLAGAGSISLRVGHNASCVAGGSGVLKTPINTNVGANSLAFTTYGKCYYGASLAASGLSMSQCTTLDRVRLENAGGIEFADRGDIRLWPGHALIVRGTPAAQGNVTVSARIRILPLAVANN